MMNEAARHPSIPPTVRPGRPTVRTTYQLKGEMVPHERAALPALMESARSTILNWIGSKYPEPLPADATAGTSFEVNVHGQVLQCIGMADRGLWTIRLTQPDAPHVGRAAVAGRTWTTELTLVMEESRVAFGVRVRCASLPYATAAPIALTRPRIVVDLAEKHALQQVRPIVARSWRPRDRAELVELRDFLADSRRQLAVHLLTAPEPVSLGLQLREFLLDHEMLGKKLEGLAHVVTLPRELSRDWADVVGDRWGAYRGAVRTYLPGLDFTDDSPYEHPLVLAERVLRTEYLGNKMEEGFEAQLIDWTRDLVARSTVEWGPCVFFGDAQLLGAAARVQRATSVDERLGALEAANASLAQRVNDLQDEASAYNNDAMASDKMRQQAEEESRRLRFHLDALRAALEVKSGSAVDAAIPLPQDWDGLAEWAQVHLAGRLVLHSRVLNRSLKEAQFDDVSLAANSLLLLAREYRNMRMGLDGAKSRCDTRLAELRLEISPSIAESRAGEHGDDYYIRHPYASSPRCFLDLHLKNLGNSREPARCLRVYFLWDESTSQVIVGWLPGHLDTRIT